jgi:hypothetical protein
VPLVSRPDLTKQLKRISYFIRLGVNWLTPAALAARQYAVAAIGLWAENAAGPIGFGRPGG